MQLVTYDLLESDKDWLRFLGRLEKAGHFHVSCSTFITLRKQYSDGKQTGLTNIDTTEPGASPSLKAEMCT